MHNLFDYNLIGMETFNISEKENMRSNYDNKNEIYKKILQQQLTNYSSIMKVAIEKRDDIIERHKIFQQIDELSKQGLNKMKELRKKIMTKTLRRKRQRTELKNKIDNLSQIVMKRYNQVIEAKKEIMGIFHKSVTKTIIIKARSSVLKPSQQSSSTKDDEINNNIDYEIRSNKPIKVEHLRISKQLFIPHDTTEIPINRYELDSLLQILLKELLINTHKSPINEYYINNLWNMITRKVIATEIINKEKIIKNLNKTNKNIKEFLPWKSYENIEIILSKKDHNKSIKRIVNKITKHHMIEWITTDDQNSNVIIKGVTKSYINLEKELIVFEKNNKISSIHINVYFTKADLYEKYNKETDKTNISNDTMVNYSNTLRILFQLRESIPKKKELTITRSK